MDGVETELRELSLCHFRGIDTIWVACENREWQVRWHHDSGFAS